MISYYSGKETMRELAARLGQTFDATRHTIVRTRIALRKCVENAFPRETPPVTEPLELHDDPKLWQVYVSAGAVLDGTITADEAGRFDELLRTDVEVRRQYIQFMHDSAVFCQWSHAALRPATRRVWEGGRFFFFPQRGDLLRGGQPDHGADVARGLDVAILRPADHRGPRRSPGWRREGYDFRGPCDRVARLPLGRSGRRRQRGR